MSQSDVDAAVKKVTANDSKELTDEFKDDLKDDGYYVLESTLKAGKAKITATPAVGQQASNSSVAIKVTYSALAVKESDLKKALTKAFEDEIDKDRQELSSEDILKDAEVEVVSRASDTVATLSVSAKSTVVPIIDTEALKKQVGGKKDGVIRDELGALPGIKNVEVNFSPFWVSTAPKNPAKITIVLQEVATEEPDTGNKSEP